MTDIQRVILSMKEKAGLASAEELHRLANTWLLLGGGEGAGCLAVPPPAKDMATWMARHAARDAVEHIQRVLASNTAGLSATERRVVGGRFFEDSTLEVLASGLGVGKERVRQLQISALAKLKRHLTATAA